MSAKRTDRLVVLGLVAATAVICLPLLVHPVTMPAYVTDLVKETAYATFCRLSILRFGQFPFRCPYLSGGYPLYAYPEDISLSPRMVLIVAFGPWAGLKLDFVLTMFLAAWGTYALTRRQFGWPVPCALVSVVIFAYGGFFIQRWVQGWLTYRAAVFPWVLYFWWRSRRDGRYLAACGLIMGCWLLDGKYALAVCLWFLVLWMLLRLDRDGGGRITDPVEWWRFAVVVLLALWAIPLAGIKLLPFVPLFLKHLEHGGQGQPIAARSMVLWAGLGAIAVLAGWVARLPDRRRQAILAVALVVGLVVLIWFLAPTDDTPTAERLALVRKILAGQVSFGRLSEEPDSPVPVPDLDPVRLERSPAGWLGVGLALLAVIFRPRQVWRWTALAILLFWMDLGTVSPANLLLSARRLPGLHLLRNAEARFNLYLLFTLALLAGRGARLPVEWIRARWARSLPWALAAAGLVYFTAIAWPRYQFTVAVPVPEPGPPADFLLYRETFKTEDLPPMLMYRNRGVTYWGLDLNDPRVAAIQPERDRPGERVNPLYRGEVYFWRKDSPNTAHFTKFTPLEIVVAVDVKEPDLLCLNQLADDNWRVAGGTLARGSRTLAVRLDRLGQYEVRLRYVPTLFYWGVAVTAVALLAGLAVIYGRFTTEARRPRRRG